MGYLKSRLDQPKNLNWAEIFDRYDVVSGLTETDEFHQNSFILDQIPKRYFTQHVIREVSLKVQFARQSEG